MQSTIKNQQSTIYWPSAVQFGLSLLAILTLLALGAFLALSGTVDYYSQNPESGMTSLLMSAGLILSGILLVPSAFYALLRLLDRPDLLKKRKFSLPVGLIILAFPVVLLLGNAVQGIRLVAPVLLPFLHLLAIGIPVVWVLYIAGHGLPLGSPQRAWGVFGTGLVLAPALILVAELAALVLLAFLVIGVVSLQPDMVAELQDLAQRLPTVRQDPQEFLRLLAPFLSRPIVIYLSVAYIAGIVPLIEEALKPLGVWLLVGRSISPAAGFAAGVLSGAGYALFESLFLSASGGEAWAIQSFVRSATAFIHIANTGLVGYGLALAWQEKQYIRLGLAYLLAVTLHGLWNGITALNAIGSLLAQLENAPSLPLVTRIGTAAPYCIAMLTLEAFIFLILGNRLLRGNRHPKSV